MTTEHRTPLTVNLIALVLGAIGTGFAAATGASTAAWVASWFMAMGAAVAVMTWVHGWLMHRERLERLEFEQFERGQGESALFAARADTFPTARLRGQFERFLVPAFTVVLAGVQGFASYWFWTRMRGEGAAGGTSTTVVLSLHALIALVMFVLGKYSSGMARHAGQRLLRPAGSQLLLGAFLSGLCAVGAALGHFGFGQIDLHLAHGFAGLLVLVGVETVLSLVLEIYRPRVAGQEVHPPYESRLLGVLGQPDGLLRTAAQTLDYQFGFKVSETWFYRYVETAFSGLVLLQLTIAWFSTCVVVIEPHEQALLERFGKPVVGRPVLDPGLHVKWPWPVDRAHVFPSQEIRTFNVGFVPDPALEMEDTLLWTRAHYLEEFNLLVASGEGAEASTADASTLAVPVNLITVSIPVQYRVTNLVEWAVGHVDGERVLPMLATSEVTHYLVSVDFEEFMSRGRQRAASVLRERIQARAVAERLGVEILFVGLQDVHPPVQIAGAFEAVVGATQERETRVLNAEAYRAERLPRAEADAAQRVMEQRARGVARLERARADAARFTNQMLAASVAPAVYRTWAYHDALGRGLAGPRKFVLTATNSQDQFWFNFEDKLRTDLLDIQVPVAPAARPASGK